MAFLLLVNAIHGIPSNGQDSAVKRSDLEQKRFLFAPQFASPMRGNQITLDPGYVLSLKGDTLVCELPYFGRLYQATPGNSDGGIKCTSSDFGYVLKDRKKKGWDIVIETRDVRNRPRFVLTVFDNGSASLSVSCNDRQPISYRGTVESMPE